MTGTAPLCVRRRVALNVTGCPEHPYQIFLPLRDKLRQRRAQLFYDRANGFNRGERVSFALTTISGSQGLITSPPRKNVSRSAIIIYRINRNLSIKFSGTQRRQLCAREAQVIK